MIIITNVFSIMILLRRDVFESRKQRTPSETCVLIQIEFDEVIFLHFFILMFYVITHFSFSLTLLSLLLLILLPVVDPSL